MLSTWYESTAIRICISIQGVRPYSIILQYNEILLKSLWSNYTKRSKGQPEISWLLYINMNIYNIHQNVPRIHKASQGQAYSIFSLNSWLGVNIHPEMTPDNLSVLCARDLCKCPKFLNIKIKLYSVFSQKIVRAFWFQNFFDGVVQPTSILNMTASKCCVTLFRKIVTNNNRFKLPYQMNTGI